MSFNKRGFTITEILVAGVLFLVLGSLIFIAVTKALQSVSSSIGEGKQTATAAVTLDNLLFDIKHAGYGISVDENSTVISYCNGSGSNDACIVANDVGAKDNKVLLLKETTNILDTGCSDDDPDFGFGFVMWNGSSVVYNATSCDVCGSYKDNISCEWLDGEKKHLGNDTCCNAPNSSLAFGFPIDTDTACQKYGNGLGSGGNASRACCNKQYCTGIVWYLNEVSTPNYCFNSTSVLYRKTTNSTGGYQPAVPVLNCVADWDIWFGLDTDGDGNVDTWVNNFPTSGGMTNAQIKKQLKLVKVYFFIQASYSPNKDYDYCSSQAADCDDTCGNGYVLGDRLRDSDGTVHNVCLKHPSDPNWVHYRWNILTLTVASFPDIP